MISFLGVGVYFLMVCSFWLDLWGVELLGCDDSCGFWGVGGWGSLFPGVVVFEPAVEVDLA